MDENTSVKGIGNVKIAKSDVVFETPKFISDINNCIFYHTMELPGYGVIDGTCFDLRGREEDYLGNISVDGKRVLDVGTASGFNCFYLEKKGAEVIALDISPEQDWDIIPYPDKNIQIEKQNRNKRTTGLNNAFWLAHRLNNSKAKLIHGTIYEDFLHKIGPVDVSIICSILLHTRDPFRALTNILSFTKETAVITEINYNNLNDMGPILSFAPSLKKNQHQDVWWRFTPDILQTFLGMAGFKITSVKEYSINNSKSIAVNFFTITADRAVPL